MNFTKRFMVTAGKKACVALHDLDDAAGLTDKQAAAEQLSRNIERLAQLQYRFYAENRRSLLIVLQAMDGAGKDGTIRHVMSGLNPQSCHVTSFKAPSTAERAHDFLWRIHRAVPATGEIGIFNRSHYEDVLVVRVHDLVPQSVWSQRYEQINAFERHLADNGTTILKFFLHISKDEQRQRLEDRLRDPDKNWKVNPADAEERRYWDDYMEAYEEVFRRCSAKSAPWFIIPANKKWFRNLAVSSILVEALERLDPQFPKPSADLAKIKIR
jgi:PPK2 family polyphosphate:nucleotide phosphotransferase